MKALAGFILQRRMAALLVVTGSVVVPLLSWLSAAALALVTLRRGPAEGAFVAGLATLVMLGASLLSGASAVAALLPLFAIWLPAMLGGAVLRATVSWPYALEILAAAFVVAMLVFHAALGDPTAFWAEYLGEVQDQVAAENAGDAEGEPVVEAVSARMTGMLFGGLLAVSVAGLVLARYWQALLFNPGGFQSEFHALRLQSGFALATLGLVLASGFIGPGPVNDAAAVMTTIFVLQGLAVIHALARDRGWAAHWLIPVYLLLPVLGRLVAFLGLFDVFADLRQRLIKSGNDSF